MADGDLVEPGTGGLPLMAAAERYGADDLVRAVERAVAEASSDPPPGDPRGWEGGRDARTLSARISEQARADRARANSWLGDTRNWLGRDSRVPPDWNNPATVSDAIVVVRGARLEEDCKNARSALRADLVQRLFSKELAGFGLHREPGRAMDRSRRDISCEWWRPGRFLGFQGSSGNHLKFAPRSSPTIVEDVLIYRAEDCRGHPGPRSQRRGRPPASFWAEAKAEALRQLRDDGFPISGDGGQARLERHITDWLAAKDHHPGEATVRGYVGQWIAEYRGSLDA